MRDRARQIAPLVAVLALVALLVWLLGGWGGAPASSPAASRGGAQGEPVVLDGRRSRDACVGCGDGGSSDVAPTYAFSDGQPAEDYMGEPTDAGPPFRRTPEPLPANLEVTTPEQLRERQSSQIRTIDTRLERVEEELARAERGSDPGLVSVIRHRREQLIRRRAELRGLIEAGGAEIYVPEGAPPN